SGHSFSATGSYLEPLSKALQVEIAYQHSQNLSRADNLTTEAVAGSPAFGEVLPTLSSDREALSVANQLTGGLSYVKGKHRLTARAGFAQTLLTSAQEYPLPAATDKTFRNVLPSLVYQYDLGTGRNLRLIYRTQNTLPTAEQLQNV